MLDISSCLGKLTPRHQAALAWFYSHEGADCGWPGDLPDGTHLASRAKGIYKPAWAKYALSVRESLTGPYMDREPDVRPNGTWSYMYYQESSKPSNRDSQYTNQGLMECLKDAVPIGVFRQVSQKPSPQYRVLGLAAVVGWEAGYFHLEGFSSDGLAHDRLAQAEVDALVAKQEQKLEFEGAPDLDNLTDGRERTIASIVRRRGQPGFRKAVIEAYGGQCAISGCDAEPALKAAHIVPYKGPQSNQVSNGILLRCDLHTLFDLGLLAVDTTNMTVVVAPELEESTYNSLAGQAVSVPKGVPLQLTVKSLDHHSRWSGLVQDSGPA